MAITISNIEDASKLLEQLKTAGVTGDSNIAALEGNLRFALDPSTSPDDIERWSSEAIRVANQIATNWNSQYDTELQKLQTEAQNFANAFADGSEMTGDWKTRYDDYLNKIQTFNSTYGTLGFNPYQDPVLKAGDNGYIEQIGPNGQPVSASVDPDSSAPANYGNTGEGLNITQADDGTWQIIGAQTGNVYQGGFADQTMANAAATQLQSGGTPTLTGAPGLYALEPTEEEKNATFGKAYAPYTDPETGLTINPQVATPEQLQAASQGQTIPNLNTPVQVRNVEELQRLAGLGLSESDITRQGSSIFLNPGVNEDMLRQRSASGTPTGQQMITSGTGAQVPGMNGTSTGGQFATTGPQAEQAASRIGVLGEIVGDSSLSDEYKLMGTIGQGIIDQEKALRELPDTIRERTQNVGVTQGQLNRLIATEREPIAQALKDLLMSRSLLQEQIGFAKEERAYQEEQYEKKFEKLVAAGAPVEMVKGTLQALDEFNGLPTGTHESMYRSQMAANEAERQAAALETASKVVGIMNDLPLGQSFTIGGQTYTGLNTGNIKVGTEEDPNGNVTLWQYDQLTGQYSSRSLGNIGTGAGWETVMSNEGAIFRSNPTTGQLQLVYDPNKPGGGEINGSGGLFDAFPEGGYSPFTRPNDPNGIKASQCGALYNDTTAGPKVGDSFESKMAVTDPSITAANARVGDTFVQDVGSTGHIGYINSITTAPDGTKIFTLTESNWEKDENGRGLITHTRQVRADQIAGFGRHGFNNPAYNFGTDAGNTLGGYTFGDSYNPQNLSPEDVAKVNKEIVSSGAYQAVTKADDLYRALEDFESLYNNTGGLNRFVGTQAGELLSAYNSMTLLAKEFFNLGVLNGPDLELIQDIVPPPNRLSLTGGTASGLTQLKSMIENTLNARISELQTQYGDYNPSQVTALQNIQQVGTNLSSNTISLDELFNSYVNF